MSPVPTPGLGHKSYLQIGKESVYGTAVAATGYIYEIIREDLHLEQGIIQDPSLCNNRARRGIYQGGQLVRGTIVIRANYEGLPEIFRGCFGGYTFANVEAGVNDHTFKLASTLPSYTLQVIKGDVTTGTCFRVTGAKFVGCTIRGAAGQGTDAMLTVEISVLAQAMTAGVTPTGSLTALPTFPVLFGQATVIDDGTADAQANLVVKDFEAALEQPFTDDRFYFGATNIAEPLPSDFVSTKWRITEELNSTTGFTALSAFTPGSPLLKFQHPTTIGTVNKREFEVRSDSCQLTDAPAAVDNFGPLRQILSWEAFNDPSALTPLQVRIRSTQGTLT
jgi:hypothetical protein